MKKKKPSEALFHPLPGTRPWIRRFSERVSTPCGVRGGVKGQGRGVRATSVVPLLRPSLLAEGVHTSVAGAMRSRAEGDCGGVAKCAPENSRHAQGPT